MGEKEFRSLAQVASRLDFFAPIKGAELDRLLSHIQLFGYKNGETIFRRGDAPDAFYIIHEGFVKIQLNQRRLWLIRKVASLGPGNLFGEIALLEDRPRSGTAVAAGPAQLFVVLKDDFNALLRQNPALSDGLKWVAASRKFENSH